jgi:hypothetical protein
MERELEISLVFARKAEHMEFTPARSGARSVHKLPTTHQDSHELCGPKRGGADGGHQLAPVGSRTQPSDNSSRYQHRGERTSDNAQLNGLALGTKQCR